MDKVFLLKVDTNIFYDKFGNQFWVAQYDLSCSVCQKQRATYFTTKSHARYCYDCATILSLAEVFNAQMELETRKAKILERKELEAKRLKEEQKAAKKREQVELDQKACSLYEAFMDYHRVNNQYFKPAWDDAIEGDKDHFYHMADNLITGELCNE